MKTLIINGSPRENGDTAKLLSILKQNLNGEVIEVSAFSGNISPCTDCRECRTAKGCDVRDDMRIILDNTIDNIAISSPIYDNSLPSPMIKIQNRLNFMYANKKFMNIRPELKSKKGAVILVGGGEDNPHLPMVALPVAEYILERLNAKVAKQNIILYQNTDNKPAIQDIETVQKIKEIAERLNET